MKEVKIFIEDNGNKNFESTDVLLEQLKEEYDKPRQVVLELYDNKGQIVSGRCTNIIGTLENGVFLLIGNIDNVFYEIND